MGKDLNARLITTNTDKRLQNLLEMVESYEEPTGLVSFIENHKRKSENEKMEIVKKAQAEKSLIERLDKEFETEMEYQRQFTNCSRIKVN